jgi:hypothetical protein
MRELRKHIIEVEQGELFSKPILGKYYGGQKEPHIITICCDIYGYDYEGLEQDEDGNWRDEDGDLVDPEYEHLDTECETISVEPDEADLFNGDSPVDLVLKHLEDHYYTPSVNGLSHDSFEHDMHYETEEGEDDYYTGESRYYSIFLKNFSYEAQLDLFLQFCRENPYNCHRGRGYY